MLGSSGNAMIEPGYHWRDGWYFMRLADGAVRIRRVGDTAVLAQAIIPPDEWASIVAAVDEMNATEPVGVEEGEG